MNVLFAPDHVVVVELSMYVNANAIGKSPHITTLKLWRNERIKASIIDYVPVIVEYFQYGIANDPQIASVKDIDKFLHHEISGIVVPEADLWNLQELITRAVKYIRKEEASSLK